MKPLYIIAEAAQGYEGSVDLALMLVRAAKAGQANAVKFQIIFASDLCEPGYVYYDLFKKLEMPAEAWRRIRDEAHRLGLEMVADVFGPASLEIVVSSEMDGIKLHSTNFFDDALTVASIETGKRLFVSIGGIEIDDVAAFVQRHPAVLERGTILFGYQAEPTPINENKLNRISALRELFGIDVGFMDHSDGDGCHTISLSAMALALGVSVFEKHITLDRALELEDYVSALPPSDFAAYASQLRDLATALGDASLTLSADEIAYRSRALKRVVAARDLAAGRTVEPKDIRLSRPATPEGLFNPIEAVGRTLSVSVSAGAPITKESLR
jgi:N,N'-diacetyllegionaminate synthase